jgi:protein-disulfide isomerase
MLSQHGLAAVRVRLPEHTRSADFGRMAAMNPSSTDRPSRRTVVLAFAVAIGVAVAFVAVALLLRTESSTAPPTATPVVDLTGIPQHGRVLGSPNAKVMLIEYADPQCPGCRVYTENFFPTVVNAYVRPGKVDTEFRGFPFIGADSVKGYRFFLAAAEQNKLWNLQEAMYRNQGGENSGWVTDDLIRELASQIPGLDVDQLFADAESTAIVQEADGAEATAQAAGIEGTPTLLVKVGESDPYLIQVATIEQLRAALDDALAG